MIWFICYVVGLLVTLFIASVIVCGDFSCVGDFLIGLRGETAAYAIAITVIFWFVFVPIWTVTFLGYWVGTKIKDRRQKKEEV